MEGRGGVGRGSGTGLLVLLALLAAGWWFLAPPAVGGATSYVATSESTSTPDLAAGGLVLLRQQDDYSPGQVVGHRKGPDGTVGLGRIVEVRGDRFVVHRDRSRFAAGYRPREAEVLGSEWLYVPHVAALVSRVPASGAGLGLALFVGVLLLRGGRDRTRRPVSRPATRLHA